MSASSGSTIYISDFFIVTAVIAAFYIQPLVGGVQLGLIALCLTFMAVWNRPLILRFWACGMLGFGTGMFAAGVYDLANFPLQRAEIVGWGAGIVVGTLAAILLFLSPSAFSKK